MSVWPLCGVLITILMPVVIASRAAAAEVGHEEHEASHEVFRLLEEMPNWPSEYSPDGQREAQRIEQMMRRIAAYDLGTIRDAMLLFTEKHLRRRHWYGAMEGAKLFLLNKFLFDLPETLPRDSPHIPYLASGWWTVPHRRTRQQPEIEDWPYVRWPWIAGPDGGYRLILRGRLTTYMGPEYDAVGKFDYLRKHFPRRKIPQPVRPSVDLPAPPEIPRLETRGIE